MRAYYALVALLIPCLRHTGLPQDRDNLFFGEPSRLHVILLRGDRLYQFLEEIPRLRSVRRSSRLIFIEEADIHWMGLVYKAGRKRLCQEMTGLPTEGRCQSCWMGLCSVRPP